MTNEKIATLVGAGDADELIPLLWERTRKLYRKLSNVYASRYSSRCQACGVTAEDLQSESYFAMLDSVKAYNKRPPEQSEYAFTTYCGYHFRNRAGALLGLRSKNKFNEPLNSAVSLNAPVSNGSTGDPEETELIAFIPDEHSEDALNSIDEQDFSRVVRETVREELADDRESLHIIEQRFYENKTFEQIGAASDLTGERIRQIQEAALRRLRKSRKIQMLAGKLDPYRHIGVDTFRREGSIVEQIVERQDANRYRYKINRYAAYFDTLGDAALKKDLEMMRAISESSRNGMWEMIEALNDVTRRRGLGVVPLADETGG